MHLLGNSLKYLIFAAIALFFWGCDEREPVQVPKVNRDLEAILKEGKLRALVRYSTHGYFLYKGQPLGFEYELLRNYANEIGVELEIIVEPSWDSLFARLNSGDGDIIASDLRVTLPRKEQVLFTEHHNTSRLVLVQRKPNGHEMMKRHQIRQQIVKDPLELIGKVVSVRNKTMYMHRLDMLMKELGDEIKIDTVIEMVSLEKLAEWVAEGRIDYTLMEEHKAKLFAREFPILDVSVPVSFRQKVAWAVRKESGQLKASVDRWMRGMRRKENPEYYFLFNKYFKNYEAYARRKKSEWYGLTNGKISPWDKYFKMYEDSLFTWTVLASMAYQESHFISSKTSWAGAMGLMQLMPITAEQFNVAHPYSVQDNLQGAIKYLHYLKKEYWAELPADEQLSFILASYNTGPGHVLDARRLTQQAGRDPNKWRDVEEYLLKLGHPKFYYDPLVKYGYCRGEEPVNYVREILSRNKTYQDFLGYDLPLVNSSAEKDSLKKVE